MLHDTGLSLLAPRLRGDGGQAGGQRLNVRKMVPWFILGFVLLAALRSIGLVPDLAVGPIARTAGLLTVVSMAALGLGVDVRVIGRVGSRVTAAVALSLLLLLVISIGFIRVLALA